MPAGPRAYGARPACPQAQAFPLCHPSRPATLAWLLVVCACRRTDVREGTLHTDAEFLEFVQKLSEPETARPSAEVQVRRTCALGR
jgi:hypothetical protein